MSDEFTDRTRAERAFTDLFTDRVAGADFPSLDPVSLTKPARRRWPAWLGAVAAVAAIAVVVAVAVPLWNGRAVPAAPAAPSDPGVWSKTVPTPIGQRYWPVSLWAEDAFYILGGNSHCGLDDQGHPLTWSACRGSLPSPGESRADGARYDPATDTWTKLADAPVPIGAGQGVVVGKAIYLITESLDGGAPPVLRYDLGDDSWTELPQPAHPGKRKVRQLLTWGGELYAATVPVECPEYECAEIVHAWDATTNAWTEYASGHPTLYNSSGATALVSTSDGFVSLTDSGAAAFTADTAFELPPVPFEHPTVAYAVGDVVVALSGTGHAYTLDLADPVWLRRTPPTTGQGGLMGEDAFVSSARFSDGSRVVVAGQLLDPVAGTWTDVPTLPNPEWSFGSFAGNGDQILACYVGPPDSLNDCYLLELGEPTTTEPPNVPVDTWLPVPPAPLDPRTQAITTWVGGEFLIVGGRYCEEGTAELYEDGSVGCPARTLTANGGAAYNPESGQWRTITTPPVNLVAGDSTAVLGDTLYVISILSPQLWGYHAPSDTWHELPPPPGGTTDGASATELVASGEVLLALGGSGQSDAWYDPATGTWTELPAGTYPNGIYPNEGRRTAAFTGKELLIGEPSFVEGSDELALTWSVFDLDYDGRLATLPSTVTLGPTEGLARPVVNQSATTIVIPWPESAATVFRTGGAEKWIPVPEPESGNGPLVPGLVAGNQVSLRGSLFNPETGAWRRPAALPDGLATGAIQAASPDTVLSCFTLTGSGELGSQCYLLRL